MAGFLCSRRVLVHFRTTPRSATRQSSAAGYVVIVLDIASIREENFISGTAYLDCSGKKDSKRVTLAALAATHALWSSFNEGWREVLKLGYRPVPYMHMNEALSRSYKTPFRRADGWSDEHVWELIWKLIKFIHLQRDNILMFSCEIDMDAWRNLHIAGNNLPSEIDLCNRYCSEHILAGFAHAQVGRMAPGGEVWLRRDDLLHFVFDRNEEYFGPFRDKRDAELKKVEDIGKSSMWQLVGDVTEGVMKESPGIQAADMFAWALNRENTMPYGSKGTGVADAMRAAVGSCMKVYDEESLRREYGSDFP